MKSSLYRIQLNKAFSCLSYTRSSPRKPLNVVKSTFFSHGSHETVAIGDDGWKKKYFSIHGGYGRASYDKRTQITIRQVMEYGIRRCIDKYPFIPIRKRKIKFRRNDKLPFCYNRSLSPLRGNLDLMSDTAILFGNNPNDTPACLFPMDNSYSKSNDHDHN